MKKRLFSLFVILSMLSGMAYAYDADGNANKKREIDGAPGFLAYREYLLVRWAENGASPTGGNLSAGDVVVADCVSDDGVTVALVSATNSIDAVRGVVVSSTIQSCDVTGTTSTTDFGRRNWGYIQVKGFTIKCNVINGPVVAGGSLVASTTARNATAASFVTTGTIGSHKLLGFAYDASADGVNSEAHIDL